MTMPLARPTRGDTSVPPPFTIDRAQVAGMSAGEAHEAILGAFDAAVLAAAAAGGMVDPAVIDAKVAELADARKAVAAHHPYRLTALVEGEDPPAGTWCFAEGTDGPPWPCPTYRAAAEVIADGLTAVVLE
jgi:hypothetical protein